MNFVTRDRKLSLLQLSAMLSSDDVIDYDSDDSGEKVAEKLDHFDIPLNVRKSSFLKVEICMEGFFPVGKEVGLTAF
jgi:hypothetical protein